MSRIFFFSAINFNRKYRGISPMLVSSREVVTRVFSVAWQLFFQSLPSLCFSVCLSVSLSFSLSLSLHRKKIGKMGKFGGPLNLPCPVLSKVSYWYFSCFGILCNVSPFDSFAMKLKDSKCLPLGKPRSLSYPVSRIIMFPVRGICSSYNVAHSLLHD